MFYDIIFRVPDIAINMRFLTSSISAKLSLFVWFLGVHGALVWQNNGRFRPGTTPSCPLWAHTGIYVDDAHTELQNPLSRHSKTILSHSTLLRQGRQRRHIGPFTLIGGVHLFLCCLVSGGGDDILAWERSRLWHAKNSMQWDPRASE